MSNNKPAEKCIICPQRGALSINSTPTDSLTIAEMLTSLVRVEVSFLFYKN